jgi:hypothetical protein
MIVSGETTPGETIAIGYSGEEIELAVNHVARPA